MCASVRKVMVVLHHSALPMQVEWNNNRDPTKGFKYIFLSDADYTSITGRADTAVLKAEPFFAENGVYFLPPFLPIKSTMSYLQRKNRSSQH